MSKKSWNVLVIFFLTISIIATSSLVYSQEKGTSNQGKDEPTTLENVVKEPVILGNEVIFYIKNPSGDFSAKQRAQKISEELKAIAENSVINVDDLEITEQEKTSIILLKNPLVTLTEQDAKSEGKDIKKLGEDYLTKIKLAVDKYRIINKKSHIAPLFTLLTFLILFSIITIPFYTSRIKVYISNVREWFGSSLAWVDKQFSKLISIFQKKNSENSFKVPEKEENFREKYRVGELDRTGKLIEYIYHSTDDYIIYRTNKVVRWLFNKDLENAAYKEYEDSINKIIKDLGYIEFKNPEEVERVETINRLTAKGIRLALQKDENSAKEVLEIANDRLESFRKIDAKLRYLIASFYAANAIIFAILFSIALPTFYKKHIIDIFQEFSIQGHFIIAISCGALGGFLSVATGIKRIDIDPDSDVMIAGMSRIFIAVISSVIIYIALRANLLPDLSQLLLNEESRQVDAWRVGFISVVAGFTESFVPNILTLQTRGQTPVKKRPSEESKK